VAKVILDTSTYVDLQRAPRHRNAAWALNTMKNAAAHVAAYGKPGVSPLGIMGIEAGFERDLRARKRKEFVEGMLPMFELISYGIEEACLGGEIYADLEGNRQRIGVVDTGIAATAVVRGLTLVTANLGHFQRIVDLGYPLTLETWRAG